MHLNKKYITIVGTIAAVLLMGAMFALPAMAKGVKVEVCHFSDSAWHVIEISENGLKGHFNAKNPHSDKDFFGAGELFDSVLNGFKDSDCMARNIF